MARLSRITVPDLPHHVTQRGNRRQMLFTEEGDYALYRDLMAERCKANGVVCMAYCLMPNHVHLVLVPSSVDGLSRAVGEAHRRFTAFVNTRARVTGHLFQGRFASSVMDDAHCLAAVRYLAFNPVRAGLVTRPEEWPWSSVKAHLERRDDALVTVKPLLKRVKTLRELFEMSLDEASALFDLGASSLETKSLETKSLETKSLETKSLETKSLETKSMTGRPRGDSAFVAAIEQRLGYSVTPQKRGPKGKQGEG
jgi:putative transposase